MHWAEAAQEAAHRHLDNHLQAATGTGRRVEAVGTGRRVEAFGTGHRVGLGTGHSIEQDSLAATALAEGMSGRRIHRAMAALYRRRWGAHTHFAECMLAVRGAGMRLQRQTGRDMTQWEAGIHIQLKASVTGYRIVAAEVADSVPGSSSRRSLRRAARKAAAAAAAEGSRRMQCPEDCTVAVPDKGPGVLGAEARIVAAVRNRGW